MDEQTHAMSADDKRILAKVVARAWSDAEFARRYDAEPHEVLREYGIELPADAEPPTLPGCPGGVLTVEELESVNAAGGMTLNCVGTTWGTYCQQQ
jgi:putative thiazole/oxazole-modified microcin (TOMM)-like peptide